MKKRTLRIVLLGAALVAGGLPALTRAADPPAPAPAPPAPTDRPARPNPADMLKNYRDQFEGLNLTDDQMKKIDGFLETAEAEVKKVGSSEDRDARRAAFQAIGKLREDVNSILTETQRAALLKKRNAATIERMKTPYYTSAVNLTADQKTKMDAVFTDVAAQLTALPAPTPGAPPDREAFRKRGEIYRDAREKANAILTPDQQKLIPAPRFGGGARGNRNRNANPPATPAA